MGFWECRDPGVDIWRAALLIALHYQQRYRTAVVQATMRAYELLDEGDVDGAAVHRQRVRPVAGGEVGEEVGGGEEGALEALPLLGRYGPGRYPR